MALIVNELKRLLGEANVVADNEDDVRLHSSAPYSYHDAHRKLPLCVAFATSEQDVCAVVRVASAHRVAIVGVGAGTNLEGQSVVGEAEQGVPAFICLSLTRMRRIVALHADDLDVVVEPGVTFPMLNAALAQHSLVFPLDAGPNATIGGMIACGASGIRAVRYGAIRNHVLSLRVVTADGAVVVTGKRAKKMVAGLDLTRLFVGSEGTLGIITLATLRVYPLLPHRVAALASFRSTADVVACVGRIVVAGVPLNMCELLDTLMVRCVNKKLPRLALPESELLYVECGANDAAFLARTLEQVREIANASGATAFKSADDEQGCDALFSARKAALIAAPALASGSDVQVLTTDVCVPVSALVQYVREAGEMVARAGLHCPLVGHVGDGNLHYFVCFDNTPELRERAVALSHDMVRLALRLDGTSTGEHGTGTGKSWCLEDELGSAAIAVHRSIKAALDPLNIMNPGKILPSRAPPSAKL